jgi:hypothetical protein
MKKLLIAVVSVLLFSVVGVQAQIVQKVTAVRVDKGDGIYGPLFVRIGDGERKIDVQAQQAWILSGGRNVVYSSSDGAGGYENEGQSLYLYDAITQRRKRIMSQYFMVETVEEVMTSKQKRALLVTMADGGLGASYVAVVDPTRGEVFFRRWARILSRKGDTIVLGRYKEDDWDKLNSEQDAKVRPYRTERYNLNSLLLRRVIVNKSDRP